MDAIATQPTVAVSKTKFIVSALVLFVFSACWNYFAFRLLAVSYRGSISSRVIISASLVAGFLAAIFLLRMLRDLSVRGNANWKSTVLKGGFWGIAATFFALELMFLAFAVFLGVSASRYNGGQLQNGNLPSMVFLSLIEIQTYGMIVVFQSVPMAFAYGGIAGGALFLLRNHVPMWPRTADLETRSGRASIFCGVLGVLCFGVPGAGLIFEGFAIGFGIQSLRLARNAGHKSAMARTGIVLGSLGLFAFIAMMFAAVKMFKR